MLRAAAVRLGKKGTPDSWAFTSKGSEERYALENGWPQFRRFYEHSRHAGGYRFHYKDNTYRVNNYASGPMNMDVFLIEDHYKYGTAGEICRLPKRTARALIHNYNNVAVHATPENIKFYSKLYPTLAGVLDSTGTTDSIPLKRLKMHLRRLISDGNTPTMNLPHDKDAVITPAHFARCLARYDIGVNPAFIEGLIVSGFENNQSSFKCSELVLIANNLETTELKILLDRDTSREPRYLQIPIKFKPASIPQATKSVTTAEAALTENIELHSEQ